jgi:protein TonB
MKRVVMLSLLLHVLVAAALLTLKLTPPAAPEEPARIEVVFGNTIGSASAPAPTAPLPTPPVPPSVPPSVPPQTPAPTLPSPAISAAAAAASGTAASPRAEAAARPDRPSTSPAAADSRAGAKQPDVRISNADPGLPFERPDEEMILAQEDPGNVAPAYPKDASLRHEQGTVLLRLHISPDGTVARVEKLVSSGFAELDAAAETALARWRFVPVLRDGLPVASYRDQPVRFIIE